MYPVNVAPSEGMSRICCLWVCATRPGTFIQVFMQPWELDKSSPFYRHGKRGWRRWVALLQLTQVVKWQRRDIKTWASLQTPCPGHAATLPCWSHLCWETGQRGPVWEYGGFGHWVPVLCPADSDTVSFYHRRKWPREPLRLRMGHRTPSLLWLWGLFYF